MIDLQSVKRKVELKTCPEHHQHPKVEIRGDKVSLSACCDKFANKLKPELHNLIAVAGRDSIVKDLNKALKKR